MKRHFTALATTLTLGGVLSASTFAAPPPTLSTHITVGTAPAAVFKGGATVNGGAGFVSTIPITDAAGIVATIAPAPVDVGMTGSLYTVINTGSIWYMRTATGWSLWNGGTIASYSTKTLAAEETIAIADLEASAGQDFSDKTLYVHVGYQVGTGAVVYSSAIQVTLSGSQPANCPTDGLVGIAPATPGGKRLCVLTGSYTNKDIRLTSNFDYILAGGVFIGGDNTNSATLTIDAGVKIYGEKGLDFLVINRGSKIHVNGTATNPVIMTSANDAIATPTTSGRWGGLVINGNAPINGCAATATVCEAEGEGSTGKYGGNNPADSSGNLNYLQIKYAGFLITPTNELNGIAFQGVGSGTIVDYVQVHNNADDGVEFFGGTVNAKHLYLTGNEDDSLDWTFGYSGKIQHVVITHRNISDKVIEADNNNVNRDSLPRAKPLISNVTVIGNPNAGGGVLLREGTGAKLSNFVITGADKFCFSIDHDQTFNNAGTSATALSGNLTVTNSVANCAATFRDDAADLFKTSDWFNGQTGNTTTAMSMGTSYINNAAVNARPAAAPFDSFFDTTTYIGAVKDAASDWTAGWTFKQ
jgi:hypothetical protein